MIRALVVFLAAGLLSGCVISIGDSGYDSDGGYDGGYEPSSADYEPEEPESEWEVEYYNSPEAAASGMPFSQAVIADDFFIMSGILGTDPATGQLVPGGIVPESHQIFANMKAVLEANDLSFEHVVKCTVMIDEISEWGRFNEVYVTYFTGPKPARSAFGADGLALGGAVELECWALMPEDD